MSVTFFGQDDQGRQAVLVTIHNQTGMQAVFTNYGASLVSLLVPDSAGNLRDVCLGFDTFVEYQTRSGHLGATVGRFANRIGGASFVLNDQDYSLFANNGANTLHGGQEGFAKKMWLYDNPEVNQAVFSYTSPHMEEGFPGTLEVKVRFTLLDDGQLVIEYQASTDQDTIINLTNHAYFNLSGQGTIHDHLLQVLSDQVLDVETDLIPTGEMLDVSDTPYDLRTARQLGDVLIMKGINSMFDSANGYDVAYVIRGMGLRLAAVLTHPGSNRRLRVFTDQPGLQVYSGQGLNMTGKQGAQYVPYSGIALETQHHPDSIHHPDFPSTILRSGDTFTSTTIYHLDNM